MVGKISAEGLLAEIGLKTGSRGRRNWLIRRPWDIFKTPGNVWMFNNFDYGEFRCDYVGKREGLKTL